MSFSKSWNYRSCLKSSAISAFWKTHKCNLSEKNHVISYLLYKHRWNTKWAFPRKLHIFSHEDNMLLYLHTWRDHRCYGYIINRAFESKLIWYFTGVCIKNRILHIRLWVWILSSRVQLHVSLVRYRVEHLKIKFIFTRRHVISSINDINMKNFLCGKCQKIASQTLFQSFHTKFSSSFYMISLA